MKTDTEKELRELDLFCIEHVMGFKKALKMSQIERAGQFTVFGEEIYIHDRGNYVKTFHPTTNPADAMAVLERCIEHGYTPLLSRGFHSNEQCEMFTVRNGDLGDEYASAETLCVAVCKFAKKIFSK